MRTGVIIVAGGTGTRMGGDLPKQFIPVAGKEVLVWCLQKFIDTLPDSEIVVVLPGREITRWKKIAAKHGLEGTHRTASGGRNRYNSVKNGLAVLGDCDLIAVQDGVRPLLSADMIRRCVATARKHGSAIPVVEPVDSFRIMGDGGCGIVDRSLLRAVQTPQVFRADILREAYDAEYSTAFTDDASVVERYGARLAFCQGEYRNIKITTSEDLLVAGALLSAQDARME